MKFFNIFRIPSLATFGTAGGLTLLYLTDWKLFLQYLPFYNGKFKKVEEEE
jgi:ubiquinol-cytochrome c reductase subunit 10